LVHIVALLFLSPSIPPSLPPATLPRLPLTRLAQFPSWAVLDEEAGFEEIVSLGVLIFDDNLKTISSSSYTSSSLSHQEVTSFTLQTPLPDLPSRCLLMTHTELEEILNSRPSNTEGVWLSWIQRRAYKLQALAESQYQKRQVTPLPTSISFDSTTGSTDSTEEIALAPNS